MSNFIYNSSNILHLETLLSTDRFETYVLLASGDKESALKLYKKNILLSHRLYTIIHILEVCLRNKIDVSLSKQYGDNWFENPRLKLCSNQKELLLEIPKHSKRGQLIASLPFGFWSTFFGRSHELLWRKNIRLIFRKETPLTRSDVAKNLKEIRTLRNRIAHHECILKMDVQSLEQVSLEVLELLSPTASTWVKSELLDSTIPLVSA